MGIGLNITRTNNTRIRVNVTGTGHRLTVNLILWAARELQEAVDAGMPQDAEVRIDNPSGVSGIHIIADHTLVQEIP